MKLRLAIAILILSTGLLASVVKPAITHKPSTTSPEEIAANFKVN